MAKHEGLGWDPNVFMNAIEEEKGRFKNGERNEEANQANRDEFAKKLKEIRNSDKDRPEIAAAKARGYLDAVKNELPSYKPSRQQHLRRIEIDRFIKDVKEIIGNDLNLLQEDIVIGKYFKGAIFRTTDYDYETSDPESKTLDSIGFIVEIEKLDRQQLNIIINNQKSIPKSFSEYNVKIEIKQSDIKENPGTMEVVVEFDKENKKWKIKTYGIPGSIF